MSRSRKATYASRHMDCTSYQANWLGKRNNQNRGWLYRFLNGLFRLSESVQEFLSCKFMVKSDPARAMKKIMRDAIKQYYAPCPRSARMPAGKKVCVDMLLLSGWRIRLRRLPTGSTDYALIMDYARACDRVANSENTEYIIESN